MTGLLNDNLRRFELSDQAKKLAHIEYAPERIVKLTLEAMEAGMAHRRRVLPVPAAQGGATSQAAVTWRNVFLWMYQNTAFWMIGQFFRKKPSRIPDVLAQTVKMPSINAASARWGKGRGKAPAVPAASGPKAISMVG